LRFAVHRPGSPDASPRSHHVSHGDIPCRIDVRVAGEVTGYAGEECLALATLRRDIPARRATLTRELRFDLFHPAGCFILQAAHQQAPARSENASVQSGFLSDVLARDLDGSTGRAGHITNVKVLDSDQFEPTRQISAELLGPIPAGVHLAGFQLRNGQFNPGTAARAVLGSCQSALQMAESTLPLRAELGGTQRLTGGKRSTHRHTTVNANCHTRAGRGNGLRDHGERDMPAARPIPGHPVGFCRSDRPRPSKPHPASLGHPYLASFTVQPMHMPRLHGHDTETLITTGFSPSRLAVNTGEETLHSLGEIAQRLLLHYLAASSQPITSRARRRKLTALLQKAWRTLAARPPMSMLLDGQVPHESRLGAMVPQRHLLDRRWEQAISAHMNTLANATDILGR